MLMIITHLSGYLHLAGLRNYQTKTLLRAFCLGFFSFFCFLESCSCFKLANVLFIIIWSKMFAWTLTESWVNAGLLCNVWADAKFICTPQPFAKYFQHVFFLFFSLNIKCLLEILAFSPLKNVAALLHEWSALKILWM